SPDGRIQMVYVYLSLYFLIFRAIAVTLCAASINKESREPKNILYSIPSPAYTGE
ncbi:hypothetical protein L9F63_009350, partial [Diploptera punctata]